MQLAIIVTKPLSPPQYKNCLTRRAIQLRMRSRKLTTNLPRRQVIQSPCRSKLVSLHMILREWQGLEIQLRYTMGRHLPNDSDDMLAAPTGKLIKSNRGRCHAQPRGEEIIGGFRPVMEAGRGIENPRDEGIQDVDRDAELWDLNDGVQHQVREDLLQFVSAKFVDKLEMSVDA